MRDTSGFYEFVDPSRVLAVRSRSLAERIHFSADLRSQHLGKVLSGNDIALIIPNYYSDQACREVYDRLIRYPRWTTYAPGTGAEQIGTIGESLYGCLGQELCEAYFDSADHTLESLRAHFRPLSFPIDQVLVDLDSSWSAGAGRMRIRGRPCFMGLCRMFRVGGEALPHDDRAAIDYPCEETRAAHCQCFVNLYVSKASAGGVLGIWDRLITDRAEYDAMRANTTGGKSYGLRRELLGPPDVLIDPPVGALVIASAYRIHEVSRCEGTGVRLSVSSFIEWYSENHRLLLHS